MEHGKKQEAEQRVAKKRSPCDREKKIWTSGTILVNIRRDYSSKHYKCSAAMPIQRLQIIMLPQTLIGLR